MSEQQQIIAQKVQSKEYYQEALEWYQTKYHSMLYVRSASIVISFLALLITFYSILAFIGFYPVSRVDPFLIYGDNIRSHYASKQMLATDLYENRNLSILRFLVLDYIETRESYDYRKLEGRYRRVLHHSAPDIVDDYKRYMHPRNPSSPIAKYERRINRKIQILSYQFQQVEKPDEMLPEYATVIFRAREEQEGVDTIITKWQARLSFTMNPLIVNEETNAVENEDSSLGFKVLEYSITQL